MKPSDLAQALSQGDRRALARAITLVESDREDHQARARAVLGMLDLPDTSLRLGISGPPGAGKSTLIDSLGLELVGRGHRVAVLAVDPSSALDGGAILGDKTRMGRLARDPRAFVRPSPNLCTPGGIGPNTRGTIALCEAAGFDRILIETVGVGQSETRVGDVCDILILLLSPGGGDELQGIKRGIMELADLVVVNKADGELRAAAQRTCAEYAAALRLMRNSPEDAAGFPKAMAISATEPGGAGVVLAEVAAIVDWRRQGGHFARRRALQARRWYESALRTAIWRRVVGESLQGRMEEIGKRVQDGEATPWAAVSLALAELGGTAT